MQIYYEKKVSHELKQAIEDLKKELASSGFGVLWELNFKDKFKEKGIEYKHNFWIFEVCNPKIAIGVLESNQKAGYFLPCKMVVYENDQGVFTGMAKPTELIGMLDDSKDLVETAKEVENTLSQVIDNLANS
ncbi:DUF302 domain-containing protein [Fusibacter sp. JL216-2]|uniref:DUF302 domain-containing protein n=1 Tax=Fusibacter sp. JL216-2 TaxID=3071453 RepID=UPI003D33F905